jgi:hypothetical protein
MDFLGQLEFLLRQRRGRLSLTLNYDSDPPQVEARLSCDDHKNRNSGRRRETVAANSVFATLKEMLHRMSHLHELETPEVVVESFSPTQRKRLMVLLNEIRAIRHEARLRPAGICEPRLGSPQSCLSPEHDLRAQAWTKRELRYQRKDGGRHGDNDPSREVKVDLTPTESEAATLDVLPVSQVVRKKRLGPVLPGGPRG